MNSDHDYDEIQLEEVILNGPSEIIVVYTAAYVLKHLTQKNKCETCIGSLQADNNANSQYKMIKAKDRGGLMF